jgi:signal transduction histidine kinase
LETLRGQRREEPPFGETIERVDALLGECIAQSRTLTVQLCPPVLHEAGLTAAVEWLGRHMAETCGLNVEVHVDPRAEPESEGIRILLFEAARELLFNVVKHAETGRARVALTASPDGNVCMVVSDEGAGFVPADSKHEKGTAVGFGLFSIRERLELCGGRMEVDTAIGRGTCITISAPSQSGSGLPAPGRHDRPQLASASFTGLSP